MLFILVVIDWSYGLTNYCCAFKRGSGPRFSGGSDAPSGPPLLVRTRFVFERFVSMLQLSFTVAFTILPDLLLAGNNFLRQNFLRACEIPPELRSCASTAALKRCAKAR